MAKIPLKRAVEHDGKTWEEVEFDPSLGALEDFQAAIAKGEDELKAMIDMIVADGDVPREVARKIRASDLEAAQSAMGPFVSATPSTASSAEVGEDGEPPQPIRHTS